MIDAAPWTRLGGGGRFSRGRILAMLMVIAAAIASLTATPTASAQASGSVRPKVGLVLGGGGARGGAHLGVLEVLDELRIPVDCVAGTSMGALVGGALAAGASPTEMRRMIGGTDWSAIFDDSAGRDMVNLRRKTIDDRFFSALEFGVTKDGLRYREGAVAGEKIKLFFNELVRVDRGERNIEDLPLPLALIATDIGTGERVAMRYGNLTTAMRASMSVPGALAPVIRDGRKLVDGGLVDNVPIKEVRDLCGAEVVIAVNVGSPLMRPEEVTGVLSVLGQTVNLLTEQNVAKSLQLIGPRDIYLRPELGTITAADFERQLEAAAIGRQSALGQADKLRALSVPAAEYSAWQARLRDAFPKVPPVIAEVRVANARFVNTEELRAGVRQRDGEALDTRRLVDDLVTIYSKGDLQSLDYTVLQERDKAILQLTPVEKSWGPDYLRFGLNLASDFRADSSYNLRMLYRRTWLNARGGEWLTAMQFGSDQVIGTEFYQPLDYRQTWYLRPYANYGIRKAGLYFNGDRWAEYRVKEARLGLDAGANLGTYGQARLGWIERRSRSQLVTGLPLLPEASYSVGGISAALAIDQYDAAFFPTRGYRVNVDYFDALRVTDGQGRYAKLEAQAGAVGSLGDFIVLGAASTGRSLRDSLPFADAFALGGQGRLAAFAPGQIVGEEYRMGSINLQYRLTQPIPLLGLSAMVGANWERARVKGAVTEPSLTGNIDSYGAYIAAGTPLGPVYLGYADTPGRGGRFYLFLGTP